MSLAAFAFLAVGLAGAKPVHILVTGDMHGWLQPQTVEGQTLGGAAEMFAYWKKVEHYRRGDFLVLSAGDVATGPALSSVYKGAPAVETMNAMEYDASALGNHEFDFGLDQFKILGRLAQFPFLSANVLGGESGEDTLVPAFCIKEKLGVKIGLIGLTTTALKGLTLAGGLRVTGYAEALRRAASQARAKGAQVLLVIAHVPLDELKALAAQVGDLGIPVMMGGHSHELGQVREPASGTWIVNSGEWWKTYSRIELDYDPATGKTNLQSARQVWLRQKQAGADARVKTLIAGWQAKLDADPQYGRVLGHLSSRLVRFWPVSNFVCDAWLAMDPESDVALNNDGALRQDLEPGPLTRAVLVGLLPFNDALWRLRLTGRQLLDYLPKDEGRMGMAGLFRKGGIYVLSRTGKPLDPKAVYRVLLNNYMAETSPLLKAADPRPVVVEKDWRDPVERWLLQHPSSPEKPLEAILDSQPRL